MTKTLISFFLKLRATLNLRTKLVLAFLSILISVMAVTTLNYLNTSTGRIKEDLKARLQSSSVASGILLDSYIMNIGNICSSISNDNSLKVPLEFSAPTQVADYGKLLVDKYKDVDGLVITDVTGQVLFSNNETFSKAVIPLVKRGKAISGLFLDKNLKIVSINPVKDNIGVLLGFAAVIHDLENDKDFLTNISQRIKSYCLLYRGNYLVFMTDAEKKVHNPENLKYGAVAAEKIYKSKTGSYYVNKTRRLFGQDLFINYTTLRDFDGNPVGLLAVGETDNELEKSIAQIIANMLVISLISVITAIILVYLFAMMLTRPLNKLVGLMKQVEKGDLTVKGVVKGSDEISSLTGSFNRMVGELNKMVNTVVAKSENIAESSGVLRNVYSEIMSGVNSITTSIKDVADGNDSTSASVQETSAGIEEVAAEASNIANECSTSIAISLSTVDNARQSFDFISKARDVIFEMAKESKGALNKILELEQHSKRIDGIVKVIVQVADGINLLGLNAAIEAARAGSYGAGFTVVAEEINKLSIQTKNRVQEVTNLNKDIMLMVHESVESMKASSDNVQKSVGFFETLETIIAGVTDSIGKVDANIRKITEAAVAQAATTEEIASAIDHISVVTAESASASGRIYESAISVSQHTVSTNEQIMLLDAASKDLKDLIRKFKIEDDGRIS